MKANLLKKIIFIAVLLVAPQSAKSEEREERLRSAALYYIACGINKGSFQNHTIKICSASTQIRFRNLAAEINHKSCKRKDEFKIEVIQLNQADYCDFLVFDTPVEKQISQLKTIAASKALLIENQTNSTSDYYKTNFVLANSNNKLIIKIKRKMFNMKAIKVEQELLRFSQTE